MEKPVGWAPAACATAVATNDSNAQAIEIRGGRAFGVAEPALVLILGKETQSGAVGGRSIYRRLR